MCPSGEIQNYTWKVVWKIIVLQGGKNENKDISKNEIVKDETEIEKNFAEFPTCAICRNALYQEGERKESFICPVCKKPVCAKLDLLKYEANYCGYCGFKIYNTLEKTKKVLRKKWFKQDWI